MIVTALILLAASPDIYLKCEGRLRRSSDHMDLAPVKIVYRLNDEAKSVETMDKNGKFAPSAQFIRYEPERIVLTGRTGGVTINRITGDWKLTAPLIFEGVTMDSYTIGKCARMTPIF